MNNNLGAIAAISLLIFIVLACNASTANMSSLKVSKDEGGKQESTVFQPGETIHASATISNAPGKTTTKFRLKADEVPGMTKGDVIPGSEISVDLQGSGTATYQLKIPTTVKGGKFTIEADMMNEAGEKKDGKSSPITVGPPA